MPGTLPAVAYRMYRALRVMPCACPVKAAGRCARCDAVNEYEYRFPELKFTELSHESLRTSIKPILPPA